MNTSRRDLLKGAVAGAAVMGAGPGTENTRSHPGEWEFEICHGGLYPALYRWVRVHVEDRTGMPEDVTSDCQSVNALTREAKVYVRDSAGRVLATRTASLYGVFVRLDVDAPEDARDDWRDLQKRLEEARAA